MHKHYHFIGIGGIGMSALASLVLGKGSRVSGSDVKESSMIDLLRKKGAEITIGHKRDNIGGADCVVYSSAIKEDNPEVLEAIQKNIPILQRAELLAELMEGHVAITISGMHGKTTTTSMVSNLMVQAGLNPTTAVGGIIQGDMSHATLGGGKYFVSEADESDGSFLHFYPTYSVITNIDFEHIDYYQNWENILKAYRKFIQQTDDKGVVIGCGDDERLRNLLQEAGKPYILYGLGSVCDVRAQDIYYNGYKTRFECMFKGKNLGPIQLNVPGQHNIINALACISLGLTLSVDFGIIQKSMESYQGVKRRFQLKGNINGIQVVDDYGHHPTEITATLKTARTMEPKRLLVVFQPHRYSRTKFLLDGFVKSLLLSDYVIITDIYAASEPALDGVSGEALYKKFLSVGKSQAVYLKKDAIVGHLLKVTKPGDLVLTLGAGDIYHVGEEFVSALDKQKETKVNVER